MCRRVSRRSLRGRFFLVGTCERQMCCAGFSQCEWRSFFKSGQVGRRVWAATPTQTQSWPFDVIGHLIRRKGQGQKAKQGRGGISDEVSGRKEEVKLEAAKKESKLWSARGCFKGQFQCWLRQTWSWIHPVVGHFKVQKSRWRITGCKQSEGGK